MSNLLQQFYQLSGKTEIKTFSRHGLNVSRGVIHSLQQACIVCAGSSLLAMHEAAPTINVLSSLPFRAVSPVRCPLWVSASLHLSAYLPPFSLPHLQLCRSPWTQASSSDSVSCQSVWRLGLLFTLLTLDPQMFPGDSFEIPQRLTTVVF